MLKTAAGLYGGTIDLTDKAILQLNAPENSPDPHDGSGVVDISAIRPRGLDVMFEDMQRLIAALRAAGFAAWLRGRQPLCGITSAHSCGCHRRPGAFGCGAGAVERGLRLFSRVYRVATGGRPRRSGPARRAGGVRVDA